MLVNGKKLKRSSPKGAKDAKRKRFKKTFAFFASLREHPQESITMKTELIHLLFGPACGQIISISDRLTLWSSVFDRWLDRPKQSPRARQTWAALLAFTRCPPWEIDRGKVEAWMEQMAKDGYSRASIENRQSMISSFYRFCARQPEMLAQEPLFGNGTAGAGSQKKRFNPVRGSVRPRKINYQHAYILTAEEARRLLRAVDRESSLIAKRDYAFLLTMLLSGMTEDKARRLRWEDVCAAPEKVLPGPAWEAVLRYLKCAGRLEAIQPGDYLFAPQKSALRGALRGKAEEWFPDRPVSTLQLKNSLAVYAAWAGLEAEQVTFASLRHTAAALQLEQGADAEELRSFLGRSCLKDTRRYMKRLAQIQARRGRGSLRSRRCPNFPSKGPYTRRLPGAQPGNVNSRIHGFYARLLPQDFEALDLEQAKTMGIEQEIMTLRVMLHRTFVLAKDVKNLPLLIRITNFVGITAVRISKLLLARQEMRAGGGKGGREEPAEDLVEMLKKAMDWRNEEGQGEGES
jgi:integrase